MQSFKGREKARRYTLQALYSWLLSGNDIKQVEAFYLADRNPKNYDAEYFVRLLRDITANTPSIDAEFTPFLDRPFDSLDPIELTILRIATYELHYCFEIPFKVVLHEAIELAKTFGSQDSYKFINSVLDKLVKNSEVMAHAQ